MAKYRVGIIGGGRKGSQHARAYVLNPLTDVVAIADTDPENLELFCGRFNVPGYSDYKEMLEKEQIDIAAPILPVTPNPAGRYRLCRGGRQSNPVRETACGNAERCRPHGGSLPITRN